MPASDRSRIRGTRPSAATSAISRQALATAGVEEGFLTAVAPASTGYDASNEYYKDERDYVFAIAEALREEYLEIVNAGLVLQVDDAVLANMYDELMQQGPEQILGKWAELRVEALNHALRGIPKIACDTTSALEAGTCRTSPMPRSRPSSIDVEVRAGAYSIEAANVRHEHEWRSGSQRSCLPERF